MQANQLAIRCDFPIVSRDCPHQRSAVWLRPDEMSVQDEIPAGTRITESPAEPGALSSRAPQGGLAANVELQRSKERSCFRCAWPRPSAAASALSDTTRCYEAARRKVNSRKRQTGLPPRQSLGNSSLIRRLQYRVVSACSLSRPGQTRRELEAPPGREATRAPISATSYNPSRS